MNYEINETHDPNLKSWIESANAPDTDFPIQNLPFCTFRRSDTTEWIRTGVAIGDQVFDLSLGYQTKLFEDRGLSIPLYASDEQNLNFAEKLEILAQKISLNFVNEFMKF